MSINSAILPVKISLTLKSVKFQRGDCINEKI
jgi:hypothetical protein